MQIAKANKYYTYQMTATEALGKRYWDLCRCILMLKLHKYTYQ